MYREAALIRWREVVRERGFRSDCPLATNLYQWLTAYVLPSITDITVLQYYTASQIQPFERWSHLHDLELADPKAAR